MDGTCGISPSHSLSPQVIGAEGFSPTHTYRNKDNPGQNNVSQSSPVHQQAVSYIISVKDLSLYIISTIVLISGW